MKKHEIQIGGRYIAKVSGRLATVCIVKASPLGGWVGLNTDTGRGVRIHSAARLRRRVPQQ